MSIETNEEIKLLKERIKELEDENKKLKKFRYPIINHILDISNKNVKSFKDVFIDGYYTKEELNNIISLSCSFNQIESFEGLESQSFNNLHYLSCSNNKIKSFKGLSSANMPNLIHIDCSYNEIVSFENLPIFQEILYLFCNHNKIKSLISLPNLPKLKIFDIDLNPSDFVYQNRTIQEIYYINELLKKCQDNTKIWIVKKFLKDKIKERKLNKL